MKTNIYLSQSKNTTIWTSPNHVCHLSPTLSFSKHILLVHVHVCIRFVFRNVALVLICFFAKSLESKLDWSSMFFNKYIRLWRLFITILPKERLWSKYFKTIETSIEITESESRSVVSSSLQPRLLHGPWDFPGQNTGVGSLSLLHAIFPTQGSNPGLLHCRRILYQLSSKGSPRILEWVAYPFFPIPIFPNQELNWASCIAGGFFFTNWAMREALSFSEIIEFDSQLFKSKH